MHTLSHSLTHSLTCTHTHTTLTHSQPPPPVEEPESDSDTEELEQICEQVSLEKFHHSIASCQNDRQLVDLLHTKYNIKAGFVYHALQKAMGSLKLTTLGHILRMNSYLPVDSLLRADDDQILMLLQRCVTVDRMDAFRVLLPHIANPSQYQVKTELQSLAILAAQFGNIEAVRLLCLNYPNCLLQTTPGRSVFVEVARSPALDDLSTSLKQILLDFIEMGVNVNYQEPDGTTALHITVEKGDVEATELLLSHKACKSLENAQGKTPVDLSPTKELTVKLKEWSDSPTPAEVSLYHAAEKEDFDNLKKLLGKGVPINTKGLYGKTALSAAAQVGNLDIVSFLLSQGASPIPLGCYWPDLPAMIAMCREHADVALELMQSTEKYLAKASSEEIKHIKTQLVSLLYHCARVGAVAVANMVLKSQVKIDPNNEFRRHLAPIHVACKYGQLGMVKLLIRYKAKPDLPTEVYCNKPLHYAAFYGHIHICKYLLSYHPRTVVVNCKNIQHETPLYCVLRCQLTPEEKNSFVREGSMIFLLSAGAALIKPGRRKCELKGFNLEVAAQRWNFLPVQTHKLLMVLRDEGRGMSLASECRLVIRGAMQVPVNEETVSELGLPFRLQHYILLKDWFQT